MNSYIYEFIENIQVFYLKSILLFFVIPAKAGIQSFQLVLDSRFHGSDDFSTFLQTHQFNSFLFRIECILSLLFWMQLCL
jgi:hypothetical protein